MKTTYSNYYPWVIFFFALALYTNTLGHEHTQDDNILIENNIFTHQGVKGLKGVFSYDTFYGHFQDTEETTSMVSGGRYRPLTHAMFAIEYELFGLNPFWGHLMNVLLYGGLGMLIFFTLKALLQDRFGSTTYFEEFILIASLLYIIHPLHTEAVANIKGRDEIMSMMGAIGAFYCCIKWMKHAQFSYLLGAGLIFFLGLLSKENTITFLAIIPAGLWYFKEIKFRQLLSPMAALLLATLVFLIIRSSILGLSFGEESNNVLNNPFLKVAYDNIWIPFSTAERYATILYTLGLYVALLFFPHPLTYDYYPRHIEMMTFSDNGVVLSLLLYIFIGAVIIWSIPRKHLIGFGLFFYIASLSIVSNIFFPIGTNMSERFLFMPSLGFTLLIAYGWWKWVERSSWKVPTVVLGIVMLLFCWKTMDRNLDWKDNFTLFTTDVKVSKNSAKGNSAAGAQILQRCEIMEQGAARTSLYQQGVFHLQKAQEILPGNWAATMIEGYLHNQENYYEQAALAFNKAYQMDTTRTEAKNSLAAALRDAGRVAGEQENNLEKAESYLLQADYLFPNEFETTRLLGVLYTMKRDYPIAIAYFTKYAQMKPNDAMAIMNLSDAYRLSGDAVSAAALKKRALELEQVNKKSD